MPIIRLEKVSKFYRHHHTRQAAVNDASLIIPQGDFVFVVGSSGAGKSTLLRLLSGQIRPSRGTVYLDGLNMSFSMTFRTAWVRRSFGYVPQESLLMHRKTVMENLTMVARAGGRTDKDELRAISEKALSLVGMLKEAEKYPGQLSLGECRRIELARALINSPPVLVLDELTANLDEESVWDILHLLTEMNRQGTTIIIATHASMFVNLMRRRVVTLVNGAVAGDVRQGRYGELTGKPSPPFYIGHISHRNKPKKVEDQKEG